MLKFRCKNCGQKFKLPEIQAGKKGKCPKCKNIVVVPEIHTTSYTTGQVNSGDKKTTLKSSTYDLPLLHVQQEDKNQDQPVSQPEISGKAIEYTYELEEESEEETESPAQRRLPWIIDIFLYPTSKPGLTNLSIFIGVPLIIEAIGKLLGPFALVLGVPRFIINILIGLYMGWYFAECVRDSAAGGTRAPEAFSTTDIGEMYHQVLNLVGCYLLLAGPVFFYFIYTNRTDTIYWSLLAYAVFFFPMSLLAVIMFDSLHGLNPILLISSIFSTFFPYCGLVLILGSVVLIVKVAPETQSHTWATFVSGPIAIYIMFVVAHLLGRFYWRYQEKLNWEV